MKNLGHMYLINKNWIGNHACFINFSLLDLAPVKKAAETHITPSVFTQEILQDNLSALFFLYKQADISTPVCSSLKIPAKENPYLSITINLVVFPDPVMENNFIYFDLDYLPNIHALNRGKYSGKTIKHNDTHVLALAYTRKINEPVLFLAEARPDKKEFSYLLDRKVMECIKNGS